MSAAHSYLPPRARGMLYGALGGIALSLGGPIVRLMEPETTGWQILAWRSLAFAALMLAIALARHRGLAALVRYARGMGPELWLIALAIAIGQTCYVFAMINTTVANVTFVLSAAPLITAFFGWILLGEHLSKRSLAILVVAMAGVMLMVAEGLGAGRITGNLAALGALVTYTAFVLALRKARDVDTFVASAIGAGLGTIMAVALAGGAILLPPKDIALSLGSGIFQVGAGFLFITLATRLIKAAEVTLLALLEAILAPPLAWLVVGEVPTAMTGIGGAIVLASVVVYALMTPGGGGPRPAASSPLREPPA